MDSPNGPKLDPDVSLYLVTDDTPEILGEKDLVQIVEESIKGGVTIVQYRNKHGTREERERMASKLLEVTRRHNVPLIINDDVETCLAVGASGVHVGQDDMTLLEARKILGNDIIIGVSVASVEEANIAIEQGASYLGISTLFATPTKKDSKAVLGTRGTQAILAACQTGTKFSTPCLAIGGINASNVQRVLHQTAYLDNHLNGVAVVSAIIASPDPQSAARNLSQLISNAPSKFYTSLPPHHNDQEATTLASMLQPVPSIIAHHVTSSTLCHNQTNTVVQNFVANVCLAVGSSPIMSLNWAESSDLAQLQGCLVVNIGTLTPETIDAHISGLAAYNSVGNTTLLDPVGGGATRTRKEAIKTLLSAGHFDVIKGNEGEIAAVLADDDHAYLPPDQQQQQPDQQQRGVDSDPASSQRTPAQKSQMVRTLARRERCIALMTGATDYLSDGVRPTLAISNGSHWLAKVTGSGCALGAVVASYVSVAKGMGGGDKLLGALAGILHYEIAAERAAESVRGPGGFLTAFLDELYVLGQLVKDDRVGVEGLLQEKFKVELMA